MRGARGGSEAEEEARKRRSLGTGRRPLPEAGRPARGGWRRGDRAQGVVLRDREGESEMGIGMSEGDGGAGGRVRGEERDRGTELGLVIGAAGLQEGWWA